MSTSELAATASGAESSSNPPETSNACQSQQGNQRIELFFTTPQQLRDRIGLLQKHGYHAFNLLNKNKEDPVLDWAATIKEELPSAHVCAHYSLELSRDRVNNEGTDAHVARLRDFLKQAKRQQVDEVLIVSGSHDEKRSEWNTVVALEQLKAQAKLKFLDKIKLAVVFNPYIEDRSLQQEEVERLLQKLDTGIVSKVYLQFGTDLTKLQWALKFLSNKKVPKIAGSLFLPTPLLIAAHKKIRPSNGVVLSQEFLQGPEQASQIVAEIIEVYQRYEVETLWESPGVRTEKDVTFVKELMTLKKKEELSVTSGSPVYKRQKTAVNAPNKNTCLLLFGAHDVRLYDNVAVQKACKNYLTVIPVFLWSPSMLESGGIRAEALEVLLRESVKNLQQSLQQFDLPLICRDCPSTEDMKREFQDLLQSTGASAVYFNRDFTPNGRFLELARTRIVLDHFPTIQLHGQQSVLLYDVDKVSFSEGGVEGGYWGTLMPFLMSCKQNHGAPRRPIPQEETIVVLEKARAPPEWPASVAIEDLSLAVLPKNVRPWHRPILKRFPKMSYEGALEVLDEFFQSKNSGFVKYESERSRADKELATSNLSAHLRLGTLSPNTLYWKHEDDPLEYDAKKTFSRRLVWRDLAYFQLRCFPKMSNNPIRAHYEGHAWVTGEEERRRLEAWKWGKTGYPIVDAGMRELWHTGWMTQNVRMVAASFLVEYLRVHWVKGCEFFHYTLVDADTAINAMMWQNAGKSGVDQWNFVVSPEAGSQDPSGNYTRKWVPELAQLPTAANVHRPWQAPPNVLAEAGVVLGETYPERVVTNLKKERALSIESTLEVRRKAQKFNDPSTGCDLVGLPSGEKVVVYTTREYRIDQFGTAVFPPKKTKPSAGGRGKGGRGQRGRQGEN